MGSILIYSVFTAACGFAQTVRQLAMFRVFLGLGMGGEWASGAALVSETWPAEHRGKALGFMQSSWAIGYGAAAIVTAIVMPLLGLARRVLRWHAARTLHDLGSAQRQGAGDLAEAAGRAAPAPRAFGFGRIFAPGMLARRPWPSRS